MTIIYTRNETKKKKFTLYMYMCIKGMNNLFCMCLNISVIIGVF